MATSVNRRPWKSDRKRLTVSSIAEWHTENTAEW
jgi:hypothetical protein